MLNVTEESQVTAPYRPCVGIMLFNKAGKVFVGRRKSSGRESVDDAFNWQMPQGGIDEGEEPLAAALRELYEETNIRSVKHITTHPEWLYYDLPLESMKTTWKGKYRGQRQSWALFEFLGDESEIDVKTPGGGEFKAEFDLWEWQDIDNLPSMIIPFKREVYTQVVVHFKPIINSIVAE